MTRWKRFLFYGRPSFHVFLERGWRHRLWPWIRCSRCRSLAWAEEIIGGCGWCDRCWQYAYDTDPVLGNPKLRPY